jgi:hypothetical protein
MKFQEIIDTQKCNLFLGFKKDLIIKKFKLNTSQKNECNQSYFDDTETYINQIKSWCKTTIANNGINTTVYKKSDGNPEGRIFVKDFGIQRLSRELRNWFCCENYLDFDMQNAHPTILYNYMRINHPDIKLSVLKKYISSRAEALQLMNVDKQSVLVYMNTDKPKYDKNNVVLSALIKNFKKCREAIFLNKPIDVKPTEGTNNPKSSYMNKLLCKIENDILMSSQKNMLVPMYDGFMTKNDINIEEEIERLDNTPESVKYNVKWSNKLISSDLEYSDEDSGIDEPVEFKKDDFSYEAVKHRLEINHFLIESPQMFIKEFINYDNERVLNQLSESQFRLQIAPYKYEIPQYDKKGNMVDYKKKCIFQTWTEDENRRSYKQLQFYPKILNQNNGFYNLFKGFKILKNKSNNYIEEGVERFIDLCKLLCNNEQESFEYLMNWAAHLIQKPEELPLVAVLIKSSEGVGKDTFREYLEKIIGSDYIFTTDQIDNVIGNFNPNISNKLLIQLNETKSIDGHSGAAALKHFITTTTVDINQKNVKTYKLKNYARLLFFSNESNVLKLSHEDRRYVVIKSGNKKDIGYYNQIYSDLKNDDIIKSVYRYLMDRDISNFKPTVRPNNKAYQDMVGVNTNPLHEFLYDKIAGTEGSNKIKWTPLLNQYKFFLNDNGLAKFDINPKSIKSQLNDLGFEFKTLKINGKTSKGFLYDSATILENLLIKYSPPETSEFTEDEEEGEFIDDLD